MLLEERVGQPTTEAEAEQLALELYGLHVVAKALPGEYDDNFHLTVKSALADQSKRADLPEPKPAIVPAQVDAETNHNEFSFSATNSEGGEEFEALHGVADDATRQVSDEATHLASDEATSEASDHAVLD